MQQDIEAKESPCSQVDQCQLLVRYSGQSVTMQPDTEAKESPCSLVVQCQGLVKCSSQRVIMHPGIEAKESPYRPGCSVSETCKALKPKGHLAPRH